MFKRFTDKWKKRPGFVKPSIPNPRSSDIYLVSYPKSGNTWMRYLLAYAIWPDIHTPTLEDMAGLIPSYGLEYDNKLMLNPESPCNKLKHRIIKEHFPYNQVAKRYVKNAIYLCRDGRDAIVSYWYFINQVRGTNIPIKDFIRESATHPSGPWHDHVHYWLEAPINKLVIRYEDMLANPALCLKKALTFAKLERDESIVNQAVAHSSFSSLKEIEKRKSFKLDMLKNVDFVRQGKVGSWQELFDAESMRLFREYHGAGIASLDYIW
ncbi:MAG: sulfotransferase domain-containing protein [Gammaproteobacteria bacterium]